ncbi:MAG TPA: SufE family protein [Candidatus Omnitrophota bacterium]|nr:SufE family protein [Candidatus Omnitrophota bacterium]
MTIEELIENFELMESWEDRYKYVIDLGKALPPMPDSEKTEANKVQGCMSQVWFKFLPSASVPSRIEFLADSDAFIVKGLAAILHLIYSGKTKEEASQVDLDGTFKKLGLESHLSMNRRNGFFAMANRIREFAEKGKI